MVGGKTVLVGRLRKPCPPRAASNVPAAPSDRPRCADVVAELLDVVQEAVLLDDRSLSRLRQLIRFRFGGRRIRIHAEAPARVDLAAVETRLRERKPIRMIAQEIGVDRATIYRMLHSSRRSR